jgi:hypothetical protein
MPHHTIFVMNHAYSVYFSRHTIVHLFCGSSDPSQALAREYKPRSRPKVLSFSPVLSAQPCHLPPYTILRRSCPLGSTPLPSCISSELGLNCTVRATVEPGDETILTMRGVCGCRVAHLAAVPGRSSARDRTVTGRRSSASHSTLPSSCSGGNYGGRRPTRGGHFGKGRDH